MSAVDEYLSGTRIQAKVITTPDGARQFLRWHDSMLNIDCVFLPTIDGRIRCIPIPEESLVASTTTFSDGNCQIPFALKQTGPDGRIRNSPNCPYASGYASVSSTSATACESYRYTEYRVYPVVGSSTGVTPVWYLNGTTCAEGPAYTDPGHLLLGPEVDYSIFVEATVGIQ